MSDIPPGWKLEKASPPQQHKLPASQKFRDNWERIFGKTSTLHGHQWDSGDGACGDSGVGVASFLDSGTDTTVIPK